MSSPSRQPTASRRAEIIATLVRLSAERSPAEITTTAIAQAMQLTQGALFKHFPTKEAIRLAAMDWIEATLLQRFSEARQQAPTPLAALRAMFMAHIGFVVDFPGAPRVVFGELQQPESSPLKAGVRRLMQRYRGLIVEVLDEAAAAGMVRADLDRQAAAALFLGAVQGLVIQSMVAGTVCCLADDAGAVFELYRQGVEATS